MVLQAGDTFQGMVIERIDGNMTQLEYPVGHPHREYAEEYNREREAEGETYRMRMPTFIVPTPNRNGIPACNDAIGRFIAGMDGVAGRMETDGKQVWSYGKHWTMARVVDVDPDGNATGVMYNTSMFKNPYSNTTSRHMWALRSDPRLQLLVLNADQFPDELIDEMAQRMAEHAALHDNVRDFETAFGRVVWSAPEEAKREAFVRAARVVRLKGAAEYRNLRDAKRLKDAHTPESYAALLAWTRGFGERYTALLGEYEKRVFKPYGEKMSPIPVRRMPPKPQLAPKPTKPPTDQQRNKGVLAWHFLPENRLLRHEMEARKVEVGKVISMDLSDRRQIVACNYGLHGSVRMRHAYGYYNGAILTRTLHYGQIDKNSDKIASEHRECLGMIDMNSAIGQQIHKLMNWERNEDAEALALAALGMTADQRDVSAHTEIVTEIDDEARRIIDGEAPVSDDASVIAEPQF